MAIPKVSVVMITYGHENYIREAIEGVLMQQIDFSVELIIANDCSPDNSDSIINNIISTNKSHINILYKKHEENIGMMKNFVFALNQAKGEYVALCDGDDYWTDPLKLQKQVDFLENNKEFVIHAALARVVSEKATFEISGDTFKPKTLSLIDFLDKNNLNTCTVMFKKHIEKISLFPDGIFFGDWFLYILLLKNNEKVYILNEEFAVYRKHDKGVFSSLNRYIQAEQTISQILEIKKYLEYPIYNDKTKIRLNKYFYELFKVKIKDNMLEAIIIFFKCLYYCKTKTNVKKYIKEILKKLKSELSDKF